MTFKNGYKKTEEQEKKRIETRRKNGWWKNPEEAKRNISKAEKGKPKSEETRGKMSEKAKNRKDSLETRRKKSEVGKGEKNPMFGKTGEKHPNWQGGISNEPYTYDFKRISKKIRKRDNHTCQLCNEQILQQTKKKFLTAHHIDYNKKNNDDRNLITLCNLCNISVNTSREEWTEFFQDKVNGN
jgi:hypothetical protein